MKNLMAPNIPLALALLAAAAAALWAAARRPKPPQATGTRLASVTVMAGQSQSQPRPAVTGTHNGIRGEMAKPPTPPGRPASAIDKTQHIFHELHADGRHSSCGVCDSQYGTA
jgi:hypothetical protein